MVQTGWLYWLVIDWLIDVLVLYVLYGPEFRMHSYAKNYVQNSLKNRSCYNHSILQQKINKSKAF